MEDHGTVYATRFKRMREQIEAMKEIWTKEKAEYHGDLVDFPPMMTWPKPVQKPHPPIIVGGAFQYAARRAIRYGDGLIPQAPDAGSGAVEEYLPRFRRMAEDAGRDPGSLPVTLGGAPENLDELKRYRDLGVARMNVRLPAANRERNPAGAGPLGKIDPAGAAMKAAWTELAHRRRLYRLQEPLRLSGEGPRL